MTNRLRRRFLAFAWLVAFTLIRVESRAQTIVISDIDDTIRQTYVRRLESLVVVKQAEFAGLSTLYKGMKRAGVSQIDYVTGAPKAIASTSKLFLELRGFPGGKIYARGLLDSTVDHKLAAIRKILGKTKATRIALVGDNGEHDPDIFDRIARENPSRTLIFMHQIYEGTLPTNQIAWLTSIDLSLQLFSLKLISKTDFETVIANAYKKLASGKADDVDDVLPPWVQCRSFMRAYRRPTVQLTPQQANVIAKYESLLSRRCL